MDDLWQLTKQLSPESRLLQETLDGFVDDKVIPLMADAFEGAYFPESLIEEVAGLGLFGLTLPSTYGGSEASYESYGVVCQSLERGDSGLRSFVSVQSSLCMFPIYQFGSEEQKQKYLPKMAKGEVIGAFGLTEPDSGSDPGSMQTTATKVDGGWRLNGNKMWITNGPISQVAIVWAKTEEGIRGFLVDEGTPGFSRVEMKQKMSLRASITGELIFQDCEIPDSALLPLSNGLSSPLQCLTQARYGISWGAMGAAMQCLQVALDYTKSRKQFNRPLASFQLIQKDLADMYNEIIKGQCLNLQLSKLMDAKEATYVHVSQAKMNACKEALRVSRLARNLLGANGIMLEYQIIRHMTNLETVFTYEGTDNIHHLVVGRHLTGENAFT